MGEKILRKYSYCQGDSVLGKWPLVTWDVTHVKLDFLQKGSGAQDKAVSDKVIRCWPAF